jgi:hypothetical protein
MIEIQLPCCDGQAVIEPGVDEVRCEACAIVHELAPDARAPRAMASATALSIAA